MNSLIPSDLEYFLEEIGTFPSNTSGAFEAYVRAVAALLFDKYCILQNASLQILPVPPNRMQ